MSKPPAKTPKKPGKRQPAPKKSGPSLLARLGRWLTLATMTGAVLWSVLFFAFAPPMPDTSTLWEARKSPGATFFAADGTVIARRGAFNGALIPASHLPDHLPHAVIATEDRRFYDHFGMDIFGFARALVSNVRAGGIVQGGSTLTQQLAKNLFLTPTRTVTRKLQELMLAIWLEARLSKDEILTLYLNRVYLGAGTYGVEAAARKYFGKSARQVTLPEAALLAGLLKAPSRYAPTNNLKRSRARAAQVLKNMVAAGYLTAKQAKAAIRAPAKLARGSAAGGSRYFIDWIQERLPSLIGDPPADLLVTTTLDSAMQRAAEIAVETNLKRDGARRKIGQAALVAFGPSGEMRAMVGGRSYAKSPFNRAAQAYRQPGSAFKPFVYLAALEAGMTPRDIVHDEAVKIGKWRPRNFNKKYLGDVTLETALAKSLNTVAVKLSERVGRNKVIATARRLGISSGLTKHASLALGVSDLSLVELSAAYAPLANGGLGIIPHGILEVRTRSGRLLYRRTGSRGPRVVSQRHIAQMNQMLSAALTSGTGRRAKPKNRPAAGKTGTSQNFRDGWFIGYTADLVAGVWVGNDDNTPMRKVTGGQTPALIWRNFIDGASTGLPARALVDSPQIARSMGDSPSRKARDSDDVVEQITSILSKLFATMQDGAASDTAFPESEERETTD
ncbi:MAG: PBP1A family penicillin-binding protein [Rhodospirillaceae bacterium]|nr:PBP1A family penicillin-binding protein [Rhodospirillaceae bacterium]